MSKLLYKKSMQRQLTQVNYFYKHNGYVFVVKVDKCLNEAKIIHPVCIDSITERFFDESTCAIKSLLCVINDLHIIMPHIFFNLTDFYKGQCYVEFAHIVKLLINKL